MGTLGGALSKALASKPAFGRPVGVRVGTLDLVADHVIALDDEPVDDLARVRDLSAWLVALDAEHAHPTGARGDRHSAAPPPRAPEALHTRTPRIHASATSTLHRDRLRTLDLGVTVVLSPNRLRATLPSLPQREARSAAVAFVAAGLRTAGEVRAAAAAATGEGEAEGGGAGCCEPPLPPQAAVLAVRLLAKENEEEGCAE